MGCTSASVVTFHCTLLGSSLANGTVWLAGGAVEIVVPMVLLPGGTEVGAAPMSEESTMAQKTAEKSLYILQVETEVELADEDFALPRRHFILESL